MSKAVATQFHPEGPDDESRIEILHPESGERNSRQIADLLALRNEARGMLITRDEIGVQTNIDPEAVRDAREIYTATGYQIRNIVDDMDRWSLRPGRVEQETLKLLETKQGILKDGREFNDRPSVMYRPRLAQMPIKPDNKLVWIVWLGAEEPQANGPHGMGASPEEAMQAFDRNWKSPLTLVPKMEPVVTPQSVPGVETSEEEFK